MVCDKRKNNFMQASGMFESFKRLNENLSIECELHQSEPNLEYINRLKKQLEADSYLVTAIWIANDPKVHYVDWSVKTISNGKNWGVLDDYLKNFNITRPEEVEVK